MGILVVPYRGAPFTLAALLYICAVTALMAVVPHELNPDYEGYRLIYEEGGAWLAAIGRDPLFVALLDTMDGVFSYDEFRIALALAFGASLIFLAPRLADRETGRFTVAQALVLTPLIALKFHVQIREGIAILLWLFAITRHDCLTWKNTRSVSFYALAAVSCLVHVSAVIWWASTLLLGTRRQWFAGQAAGIGGMFALYGFITIGGGTALLDVSEMFRDTGYGVEATAGKWAYWLAHLALPLIAVRLLSRRALELHGRRAPMAMVGTYGAIGFMAAALAGFALWGATEGQFSSVLRVSGTLAMLLAIHLAQTRPRHFMTWAVFVFVAADVVRLLLVEPG